MWFKNLRLYRLPRPWQMPLSQLIENLQAKPFVNCSSQQPTSFGWVIPVDEGDYVYNVDGQWLIALAVEQKILPSSVVNQFAEERAKTIKEQEGYYPGRKQMQEIREYVTQELLPRAFSQQRKTFAWIDSQAGWLVIDAASAGKADILIEHLLKTVDKFDIHNLRTAMSPTALMNQWLAAGETNSDFSIDRDCELKSANEDKSTVRYIHHNLDDQEVQKHLADGKQATKLALTWQDKISFMLTENFEIKRLKYCDDLLHKNEYHSDNAMELFDSNFTLMTGELRLFIADLVAVLGGETAS